VLPRLPSLVLVAISLLAVASGQAAVRTSAASPRQQYLQALRTLAQTPGFRMVESIDVWASARRSERAEIRFRAPNRLQTTVTSLLPPPIARLTTIQVGRQRCQTPPGICYHSPTRVDAYAAVHALLGPLLVVNYHSTTDAAGQLVIRMDKTTGQGSHYYARMTIDKQTGLPSVFRSEVDRDGKRLVAQTANFGYTKLYSVKLPPNARHTK
jgi:hypothetical protein